MKWEMVKLGDAALNLDSKRKPLNESERDKISHQGLYPYIGANNVMGYVDEFLFDEEILCIAEDGGSWGKNEKCASVYKEKCWVNNHAHVLSFNGKSALKFLMYYLNYSDLNKFITGTTRGKLTKTALESIFIPLLPLPTQRAIAARLDRADALRQKDRRLLEVYDVLAQSVFVEMFGDPVKNEKGWKVKKIKDCLKFITSGSRGWAQYYSNVGAKFLRIQNVGNSQLIENDLCFVIAPKNAEASRTKVNAGDILLTITADIGRTAVIPEGYGEAYINQHLCLLRFDFGFTNPYFVSKYLNSDGGKLQIQKVIKGGVKSGLNFNDISNIEIPLPPLPLQTKFAAILANIERQKEIVRKQQAESEALFGRLLQEAFGG